MHFNFTFAMPNNRICSLIITWNSLCISYRKLFKVLCKVPRVRGSLGALSGSAEIDCSVILNFTDGISGSLAEGGGGRGDALALCESRSVETILVALGVRLFGSVTLTSFLSATNAADFTKLLREPLTTVEFSVTSDIFDSIDAIDGTSCVVGTFFTGVAGATFTAA